MITGLDERNYMISQKDDKYGELSDPIGIHIYNDCIQMYQDENILYITKDTIKDMEKLLKTVKKFYENNTE